MSDCTIWSVARSDERRSALLEILRDVHGDPIHVDEICRRIDSGLRWLSGDRARFHNLVYRRVITADIDALNRDPDFPYCIRSDSNGVRLCTESELFTMLERERKEAVKKLAKCSVLRRKAGLDGQVSIDGREVSAFLRGGEKA